MIHLLMGEQAVFILLFLVSERTSGRTVAKPTDRLRRVGDRTRTKRARATRAGPCAWRGLRLPPARPTEIPRIGVDGHSDGWRSKPCWSRVAIAPRHPGAPLTHCTCAVDTCIMPHPTGRDGSGTGVRTHAAFGALLGSDVHV